MIVHKLVTQGISLFVFLILPLRQQKRWFIASITLGHKWEPNAAGPGQRSKATLSQVSSEELVQAPDPLRQLLPPSQAPSIPCFYPGASWVTSQLTWDLALCISLHIDSVSTLSVLMVQKSEWERWSQGPEHVWLLNIFFPFILFNTGSSYKVMNTGVGIQIWGWGKWRQRNVCSCIMTNNYSYCLLYT